jgi:hypothetical protein
MALNIATLDQLIFKGSVAGQASIQSQGVAGGLNFLLPNTPPQQNQLLTASSIAGNNIFLGWSSPATATINLSQLTQSGATTGQIIEWNGLAWVPATDSGLTVFGPSGPSHSVGAVPDPGAVAGTTRFLREDATWVVPADSDLFVTSVFTRTGAVVAVSGDYTVAQVTGAAPLASPTFTGVPAAPTATPLTNTTQIATTAYADAAVAVEAAARAAADANYLPLTGGTVANTGSSVSLTVQGASGGTPDIADFKLANSAQGVQILSTGDLWPRHGIQDSASSLGTSGQVLSAGTGGQVLWVTDTESVTSVFTRTGAIVATSGDYTVAQVTGAAPSASPTFTGLVTISGTSTFSSANPTFFSATGSGAVVLATSPTLVTPALGVATATSLAIGGGTALATSNQTGTGSLVLATGPTISGATLSGTITNSGTESYTAANPTFFSSTGTGAVVLATSPTLVTPVLGAASATSLSTSAGIVVGTTITSYDGLATAGLGVAAIQAYSPTTPTTPVGSTPILTAAVAGLYKITYYSVVTTSGVGGTNFALNLSYTDAFGAQTPVVFTDSTFTAGNVNQGSFVVQNQSTNNISYSITESGVFSTHPVLALKIAIVRIA